MMPFCTYCSLPAGGWEFHDHGGNLIPVEKVVEWAKAHPGASNLPAGFTALYNLPAAAPPAPASRFVTKPANFVTKSDPAPVTKEIADRPGLDGLPESRDPRPYDERSQGKEIVNRDGSPAGAGDRPGKQIASRPGYGPLTDNNDDEPPGKKQIAPRPSHGGL